MAHRLFQVPREKHTSMENELENKRQNARKLSFLPICLIYIVLSTE